MCKQISLLKKIRAYIIKHRSTSFAKTDLLVREMKPEYENSFPNL